MYTPPGTRTRSGLVALAPILLLCVSACTHTPTAEDIKYAQIRYDLGLNEAEQGNVQAALRELQVAVERHPDFAEAHNAMGLLLHLSLGRHAQAEASYLKALEIKPDFSDVHNNIGALYIDMARYAEAETHFRKALDDVLYGTPHIAQGNLGWVLYLQDRPEDAIMQLRSAVLVQPKFCQGHRNLGRIYRELGRHDEARSSFRQFVRQCPEVAEAQYEWGRIAYEQGNADEAREAFEACFRLAPDGEIGDVCHRHLEVMATGTGGVERSEG
jgi:type IV pilus assembly protein PilF